MDDSYNSNEYNDNTFLYSHMKFITSFNSLIQLLIEDNEDLSSLTHTNDKINYQKLIYLQTKKRDMVDFKDAVKAIKIKLDEENNDCVEEIKKSENEMKWISNETFENSKERDILIEERKKNLANTLNSTRDENSCYSNMSKKDKIKRMKELKSKLTKFENDLISKKKNCEEKYKKNQKLKVDNKILYENYKQKKLILEQLTKENEIYQKDLETNKMHGKKGYSNNDINYNSLVNENKKNKKKSVSSGWFSHIFK